MKKENRLKYRVTAEGKARNWSRGRRLDLWHVVVAFFKHVWPRAVPYPVNPRMHRCNYPFKSSSPLWINKRKIVHIPSVVVTPKSKTGAMTLNQVAIRKAVCLISADRPCVWDEEFPWDEWSAIYFDGWFQPGGGKSNIQLWFNGHDPLTALVGIESLFRWNERTIMGWTPLGYWCVLEMNWIIF